MNCRLVACLALCALAGAEAGAAQRGEGVRKPVRYVVDDGVGVPAEWTKRFVGRFRIDGTIHYEAEIIDHGTRDAEPAGPFDGWTESMQGKSDCIDITEAAGLQCVLNVFWQEVWTKSLKIPLAGVPDLTPGMLLAGLRPSTAPGKIQILEVDTRGLAHPGAVELRGTTAATRLPCVNMPGTLECEQIFRITAKPDSKLIFVTFTVRVRALKAKLDRKAQLSYLAGGKIERNTELLEERLTVSLSLRREPQPAELSRAPASIPPAQGSR